MPDPADSILNVTKKALGIAAEDTDFDVDIIMHINSVFSVLTQLSVGPDNGFSISDSTPGWSLYTVGSNKLNMVQSYMYMSVRMLFDPPETSFAIEAMKSKIAEYEWRLNIEEDTYPHQNFPPYTDGDIIVEEI